MMSCSNKTCVAFVSENVRSYRLIEAWRENSDFSFYDAHDLYVARDTSQPEISKSNLRDRIKNVKQVVLLGSPEANKKGGDRRFYLSYEIRTLMDFDLPVALANLDGDRSIGRSPIPDPLLAVNYAPTLPVSFQQRIIAYSLKNYVPHFSMNRNSGSHFYTPDIYERLGP